LARATIRAAPAACCAGSTPVPQGACKELRYGEGDASFALLLYRRGAEIHAYVNSCPHFGLPLNARADEFLLYNDGLIMCAHHSAVFSLVDGRCVEGLTSVRGSSRCQ